MAPMGRWSGPALTLLLLSPVIAELLFGVTSITTIFVLIPQIGTWGCAALLIRELVRRWGKGWLAILLLGTAVAIAEECLIQQTSLAPLVGVPPDQVYGRAHGVNWVYFLWALGYESLWTVVLPIQLVELIFPERRDERWVGVKGLVFASAAFLVASFIAWFTWTQLYVPRFFPESAYQVPWSAAALAVTAIAALVVAAKGIESSGQKLASDRTVPAPGTVGLVSFLLALPWFALVYFSYRMIQGPPAVLSFVLGLAWAGGSFALVRSWSARSDWNDACLLAAVSGAIAASMLAGFPIMIASGAPRIDLAGKIVFNIVAVLLLFTFATRLQRRTPGIESVRFDDR